MMKRHWLTAAVAVAVVLTVAETGLAQWRWRARRRAYWGGGRPWYVPVQVYSYYAGPSGYSSGYYVPAPAETAYPPAEDYVPAAPPSGTAQPDYPEGPEPEGEVIRPAEHPASAQRDTRISFHVVVPTADTRLWVDGAPTKRTGTVRDLASPPLQTDAQCHYVLKAQWAADGRLVTDTRRIDCYPGDRLTVDFTRPDARATVTEEIVPREAPAERAGPAGEQPGPR